MSSSSHTSTGAAQVTNKSTYMYFGYVVKKKWLLKYAVRGGISDHFTPEALERRGVSRKDVDVVGSVLSAALARIVMRAGLIDAYRLETISSGKKDYFIIVLATNRLSDGLPVPPSEKYVKLQKILKTNKEPKWYPADS